MTGVVGVDPGGRTTGVVAIDANDKPVFAELIERGINHRDDWAEYRSEVVASVSAAVAKIDWTAVDVIVAVEDVTPPNPHVRVINVGPLLDTARMFEAVCMHVGPSVVVVPPGGHGSAPLAAYPPELVGLREKAGTGRMRHARSAYDVALAGRVVRAASATEAAK